MMAVMRLVLLMPGGPWSRYPRFKVRPTKCSAPFAT